MPNPRSPSPFSGSHESGLPLEVTEDEAGTRLDRFLANRLEASRRDVRRWLEAGRVSEAGRVLGLADKGTVVSSGVCLLVERPDTSGAAQILPDGGVAVPVLTEGEGWVAVDKPPGTPVHPLHEGECGTVLNGLVARYPSIHGVGEGALRSGVIHRLDVDTSGVLLVGTQASAWQRLRDAFRTHRVQKVYRALVFGEPDWPTSYSVELGLRVAQHRPARVRVVEPTKATSHVGEGWLAQQQMRVLETLSGCALVEVSPRTGFLHQIRVSLAHLGYPVLGDPTYAVGVPSQGAARQMLHASRLEVDEVRVEAPDPADFRELLERLRVSGAAG